MRIDTLFVATYLGLLLVDGEQRKVVHDSYRGYSGVTWDSDYIYALASDGDDVCRGLVFDGNLDLVRDVPLPEVKKSHQCVYKDGEVFIANTGRNRISAWDRWDSVRTVYFSGKEHAPEDKSTIVHINSVWYNDCGFYIAEHRHGPSKIRLFNNDWNETGVWDVGCEIHNIIVHDGKLYVCNSAHEGILRRDLSTGREKCVEVSTAMEWRSDPTEQFTLLAYTRGLAFTEDTLYVGCSVTTKHGDRQRGQSAIAVLNLDLSYRGKVILDDTGGLGELRAVGVRDYGHNDFRCPWLGSQ